MWSLALLVDRAGAAGCDVLTRPEDTLGVLHWEMSNKPVMKEVMLVRLAGFEPATCCSGGNRSIHLSYRRPLRRSVRPWCGVVKRLIEGVT